MPCPVGSDIRLPDTVVRHIQALRLRPGSPIVLFDGSGREYAAQLLETGRRHAVCHILSAADTCRERPLAVTLVQAVSAGSHMDFALQKSTELGVAAIQPVFSERAARLDGERIEKRLRRWQDIVTAACEQSGRNTIPPVLPVLPLAGYLAGQPENSGSLRLILSPNRPQLLSDLPPPQGAVTLMVGAEGGWTAAEEAAAARHGFQAVGLGPRILRTETAALAALAAAQLLWGDMG